MDYERQDIKLEAKYPYLIFGDGYIAQITSIVAGKDVSGEEVYKMIIIPTSELAKRHNITLSQLGVDMTINVEYPVDMIHQLSSDPAFPVYFSFLNFKAEECIGTKYLTGKINADTIISLKRIINQIKAENAYLREQLDKAKSNIQRFIKEDIMGPASEIGLQMAQQNMMQTGPVRNQ